MENYLIYFLGILAFNFTPSLIAVWIAWTFRRKQYAITWSRGSVVLIVGWFLGSVIVFILQLAAQFLGIDIKKDNLEIMLALLVLLPAMFQLFDFINKKLIVSK